jgi:hypothetical protein
MSILEILSLLFKKEFHEGTIRAGLGPAPYCRESRLSGLVLSNIVPE